VRDTRVHPVNNAMRRVGFGGMLRRATSEIGMRTFLMLVARASVLTGLVLSWFLPGFHHGCLLAPCSSRERQVRHHRQKFGARSAPTGHLIAWHEAGYQATLSTRIALRLFPLAIPSEQGARDSCAPRRNRRGGGGRRRANPLGAHSRQVVDCDNFPGRAQILACGDEAGNSAFGRCVSSTSHRPCCNWITRRSHGHAAFFEEQ